MKHAIRVVLAFAFGCVLGIWRSPVIPVASGDITERRIRYVAVGDSIAYGYGLRKIETDSYAAVVRQYLKSRYDNVFFSNLGINGLESQELLDILQNPQNEHHKTFVATLRHADVVTVSIGSNDLLHQLKAGSDFQEFLANSDAILKKKCEEIKTIFPKIIVSLKSISPHVVIYVNNVYNPCVHIKRFASLQDTVDRYINCFNEVYQENSTQYEMIDVKGIFDSQKDSVINLAIQGKELDPHPDKKGHHLIADAVIQKIQEKEDEIQP